MSEDTGHAHDNKRTYQITLTANTAYSPTFDTFLLGLYRAVDDADVGAVSYTGTWTAHTGTPAWNDTFHLNDKLSTSKATYSFGALPAGSWNFLANWSGDPSYTTTAVWTLYQGATQLAQVEVNQTANSSGGGQTDLNNLSTYPANPQNLFGAGDLNPERAAAASLPITAPGRCGRFHPRRHGCSSTRRQGSLPGSAVTPFANLGIYDPSISSATIAADRISGRTAGNVGQFHPMLLPQMAGAKCVRTLGCFGANSSAEVEITDLAQGTELSYAILGGKAKTFNITRIDNWADADHFCGVGNPAPSPIREIGGPLHDRRLGIALLGRHDRGGPRTSVAGADVGRWNDRPVDLQPDHPRPFRDRG